MLLSLKKGTMSEMVETTNDWRVIKLGGSLLSPYAMGLKSLQEGNLPFDVVFAKELLQKLAESKKKCVLVIGGGFLNRWYLQKIRELNLEKPETQTDFHYLGMAASEMNATLCRMLAGEVFGFEHVFPKVVKYQDYDNLDELKPEFEHFQLVIGAGWKPGHSHDVDALLFASLFGQQQAYSFKDIDGIYSADPKKNPTAGKKKTLTWADYRAIINTNRHLPGASFPIDGVAAQLAEKSGMGFTVIDGRDMRAVEEVLAEGITTRGSTILPLVSQ